MAEYAALTEETGRFGAKIFFTDEAHFRADAGLRGKWVLKGEPALVDSSSPRWDEKASYYSAVCLETGAVEWMELEGNSNSRTSEALLRQLRERHSGPLKVIWDNAPAHRGEAAREYLRTPGLALRLVNLRATVRTSTPMRRSGTGLERRPPETCSWGPRLWRRSGSATSSAGWPAAEVKSNGAAGPSCSQGPSGSRETSGPIPKDLKMHIPPWL